MGKNASVDIDRAVSKISTIKAAATVILKVCEDEVDMRTKLERLAYAAGLIRCEAEKQLERLNSSMEANHD